ncbi:unnamed protein product [Camellia sinensis]
MIPDFPPDFKSYVKNNQLLWQRGSLYSGWVFWSGEDDPHERPPPPPFSALVSLDFEFEVDGVSEEHLGLLGRVFRHQQQESNPYVQYYSCNENEQRDRAISCNIKSSVAVPLFELSRRCCIGVFEMGTRLLIQFWKVVEIGGKRLLTTRHQPFGFDNITHEGLCSYRLMSLDFEFDVDGVSEEHLGLVGRVFRHQQQESTPNVQYYSCNEYLQRDHAISCNIKSSLVVPLFELSRRCCIGVFEIVSTTEINTNLGIFHYTESHPRKGQGVVGRAISSQNLVFCKDVTQFSITEYPMAHYAREHGLARSFAICLRSSYIEDNVYVVEFFLATNYSEGVDPSIALVPLLTTMKQHCKILDFSEDGKLYSYQIPPTARSPNRMENGEEMVFLNLSDQQLPEVDSIDKGNNVVTNTEETNVVVTFVQQNCIINSSQRLHRKAGIPISLEDLQQHFGMKLKDVAESLGVSRSIVKRACREYNITWWSSHKRSLDNQLFFNKLDRGVVQEQILESSQRPISDPPHMQDMATTSCTKQHFTAAQDTSIVTIKARYGDDFIKFQLPVSLGMVEFQQQVTKRLNLQDGTYRVKYQDEDNDWILIGCDEDLQNYICNSISQGRNTVTFLLPLKLEKSSGFMASSLPNCPPFEFTAKYYSGTGDSCVRQSSFFGGKAVLNQGVGYSVILGFGAFFAVFTSFLVWLEKRYIGSHHTSEWFNTAGRNVKTGLIASVIVSQWTWAATILQSSNVAWEYGVLLFGVMAIEIKRKAPYAHTVCEIVKARWGTAAHLVFLTFCFLTNIIVTAMLLLGGSAVVNALTGVNIYGASLLIPLGVIVYTLAGGLKATFLASYIHSVIVYTSSSKLGSPSIVYHRLLEVASKSRVCQEPLTHNGQSCGPVSGNYKGSYLTMLSSGGLIFGIINIVGNFGTVFVDNGYWVCAIAARPSSTHKDYLLGGLVWFAVPFSLATSLGLGALALDLPITASEASHGLVPPATAIALMGKGGSIHLLTMLFMAVTSAGSSELIAVSCLCTYDIYRTYINLDATGKQILRVSRGVVLGFGCFMGLLAVILNKAGVSLGWMYLAMGVFIVGAILGATIGCVPGIITWLSVAKVEYGRVNLDTIGRNAPMLAGNLVSILTGGAIHAVCSFLWKEKSELPAEEFKEEKLIRAKVWIVKWGVGFTVVIVLLWPLLSLPAGIRTKALILMAIHRRVLHILGNHSNSMGYNWISCNYSFATDRKSWQTIQSIILGMFTNDRLMEKVEELNLKLHTIMLAIPEAERIYLLEKGKAKKNEASEPDAHIVPA